MKICEYGCGREAKFPPRKGMRKWCCESTYHKCPTVSSKTHPKGRILSNETIQKIKVGLKKVKGKECPKCGKLICPSCFQKHVDVCGNKVVRYGPREEWRVGENKFQCPYCGRIFNKLGIGNHIFRAHTEEGKNIKIPSWNKGLTKETDKRVRQSSKRAQETFQINGSPWKGRKHKESTKKKLREIALVRGFEKHIKKNPRHIQYKTLDGSIITLQSSYELKVAKELDINNIKWTRPKPFPYVDKNGINRKYYPDFYLKDFNVYLDPKNNFLEKKDKYKIQAVEELNMVKIIVLNKDSLKWDEIKKLLPQ